MAIQREDPLRDLVQLKQSINRMFDHTLGRSTADTESNRAAHWRPAVDLLEEDGHFVLRADLPGVLPADVEIRVEDQTLVVRGERRPEDEVAGETYLRVERPVGAFSTELALPVTVDQRRIHAKHRNGVLEIVLPKKKIETPGRIEVAGS